MAVVPLIGAVSLGCQISTGVYPMKIYSLNAFKPNESHLQEYMGNEVKIEYFNDYFEMPKTNGTLNLDLVSSVLSCAGLSTLNYCLFWWTNLDIFAGGAQCSLEVRFYDDLIWKNYGRLREEDM